MQEKVRRTDQPQPITPAAAVAAPPSFPICDHAAAALAHLPLVRDPQRVTCETAPEIAFLPSRSGPVLDGERQTGFWGGSN